MSFYVDPSRRIALDRNSFDFGDLDEILEWVDFFKPEDALYAISEFQRRTGLDFQAEYEKDFGRKYVAPTDDIPMKQPTPEPSADFKREVLFYWGELQYNPKQIKFMEYTTPDDVEKWNRTYAPRAFALSQMDEPAASADVPNDPEQQIVIQSVNTVDVPTQIGVQLQQITSVVGKMNTGNVETTASRAIIDSLVQVAVPAASEQVSDEGRAITCSASVPDVKTIVGIYCRDSPVSPRRTRSNSKLDNILRQRHPKTAPDLIDVTDMDQSGRRRYAVDREMVLVEYLGRLYAVKAPDLAAAQRRLVSFTC